MTLFVVFTDVIKLRCGNNWIRMNPKFYMIPLLIILGKFEHTEIHRMSYEDGEKDQSDASTSQRMPMIAHIHQ